jgi:transposase
MPPHHAQTFTRPPLVDNPDGATIVRKNFLFAGSDYGGERAAAMYTLIGSAKLNGIDPELYLRTVLAQIADHPISHIQDLLPWNLAPSLQTDSSQAA